MTARQMRSRRHVASGLAMLALGGILSGCTGGANQPGTPGPTISVSSAAAPSASASAATASSAPPATSPAPAATSLPALKDSAPFKALTPEQQSKIASLEAMDTSTFEKQSRDDQLGYGAFLREVYPTDAAGSGQGAGAPAAGKLSAASSGDDIVADEYLKAATARRSVQAADGGTAQTGGNYSKMAPSRVSPLYPESYTEASAIESTRETALSRLSDPGRLRLVEESNNFIPFDGSWEELEFRVLKMEDTTSQASSQFYFAYTPFTNIHGAQDGVWVLMLNAGEADEKWIPDLSVID